MIVAMAQIRGNIHTNAIIDVSRVGTSFEICLPGNGATACLGDRG